MAVSKHNLWKRKKNGVMKLVRSHGEWLERRRKQGKRYPFKVNTIKKGDDQWWDKDNSTKKTETNKTSASSTKRTQVGKKI